MNVEERLTRALSDQAERIDPDVHRMYAGTMRRVAKPRVRRTGKLLRPVLVAVAVLALLVGSVAIIQHRGLRLIGPAGNSKAGGVSTSFTCGGQVRVDDAAGRQQDDSFLPSLDGGPQAAADDAGAPRYSYVEDGDEATLRLGNADGSLASVSTFRRGSSGWDLGTTTKCVADDGGILVPGQGPLRLGTRETTPYPAGGWVSDPASAVLVDDRSSYDVAGLATHRTMWASQCGGRICLVDGTPTGFVTTRVKSARAPADITSLLLDPDSMVGRTPSLVLWVVYDADRSLSVVMRLRDGTTVPAKPISGPGWRGRAYLALGRPDEVQSVQVRHRGGATTTYPAQDITDPNIG
jgi:hypothetical protein